MDYCGGRDILVLFFLMAWFPSHIVLFAEELLII